MKTRILLLVSFCICFCFAVGCAKKSDLDSSTDSVVSISSTQVDIVSDLSMQLEVEVSENLSSQIFSADDSSTTVSKIKESEPTDSEVSEVYIIDCKLIVNSKDITSGNYVKINVTKRYAELPLTAVLKGLGATIEWQSKTTAKIVIDEKEFILDTVNSTLIEKGDFQDMLLVAPGSQHGKVSKVIDDELVIDSDSTELILQTLGFKINVDCEKAVVIIEPMN